MDSLISSRPVEVSPELAQQMRRLILQSINTEENGISRIAIPVKNIDILAWSWQQPFETKIYWRNRESSLETAGIGIADRLILKKREGYQGVFEVLQKTLGTTNPGLRYYGGFSFNDVFDNPEWQEFGNCQFFVPRFEIVRDEHAARFVCTIFPADKTKENIDKICNDLDKIDFSLTPIAEKNPRVQNRTDFPSREGWVSTVRDLVHSIKANDFDKIVLARKTVLKCDEIIDPWILLNSVRKNTDQTFQFCFQPVSHIAFVGLSPERLYRRINRTIETEALAGTRSRGKTESEDAALAEELLNSKKDFCEHNFVCRAVANGLKVLCVQAQGALEPELIKLKGGHHLISRFEGNLKPEIDDAAIIETLHPTPAIAGTPTRAALAKITEKEPFARGWYTGLIGCVGYDTTEFAVAIRSGLICQDTASFFSGAGIIDQSIPDQEWEEIEHKINTFLSVLSV